MIIALQPQHASRYGIDLSSLFTLRHASFIQRLGYNVMEHMGREFDDFDTPDAWYLIALDENKRIVGTMRKAPTDRAFMLDTIWADQLIEPVGHNHQIWESSRFCIDGSSADKHVIGSRLVLASVEFGLRMNSREYIGIMPPGLFRKTFNSRGWPFTPCSKKIRDTESPGKHYIAGRLSISTQVEHQIRSTVGLNAPVLYNALSP